MEISSIHSVAGKLSAENPFITSPPFQSPHHTLSAPAFVGGGSRVRPGIISLAHRGVLFLDELTEFPKSILEDLRQPLEDHVIHSPYGDWYLYFPYYYARMEKLGLGEYSEKALLLPIEHPDCYFLALNPIEIPLLTTYYKEHYNKDVEAEEIESFNEDRFKLYKLHAIE